MAAFSQCAIFLGFRAGGSRLSHEGQVSIHSGMFIGGQHAGHIRGVEYKFSALPIVFFTFIWSLLRSEGGKKYKIFRIYLSLISPPGIHTGCGQHAPNPGTHSPHTTPTASDRGKHKKKKIESLIHK